ncbi:methylated-DNA--[protein]-cysteine S-methyltransferase [Azoarcus communis]|uniref:methylated-DNA--[protein]-cysteine S-methyltransferase n=1 Tax=Parazoarcus communis TaxID=41977 RepID=UPI00145965F8|nr:methylated-DNA--[protein]-cysteine S-methyltransferase [Parazoarcus communis]NMG48209.1 methylated-DNA--[protein]-cysteine S-methyltransferase [Parazoarcus communis]
MSRHTVGQLSSEPAVSSLGDEACALSLEVQSRHFAVIARAIGYIRAHAHRQPDLNEIAHAVHLSPHHLQRLFAGWAGVSPKRFLQFLTKERARQLLMSRFDVMSVAHETGLSSTSRLHDLMITCEAMSPGEIKSGGAGLDVRHGVAPSPFGPALIAWTSRGICHLAFCDEAPLDALRELAGLWPAASLIRDDGGAAALLEKVFPEHPCPGRLHLLLRGTNFQIKVWEALIRIEPGQLVSYGAIARASASPRAQRAVGSALAANTIAYLIPCHRVIRESGEVGNFRWGSERKLAMQGWEASRQETGPE